MIFRVAALSRTKMCSMIGEKKRPLASKESRPSRSRSYFFYFCPMLFGEVASWAGARKPKKVWRAGARTAQLLQKASNIFFFFYERERLGRLSLGGKGELWTR